MIAIVGVRALLGGIVGTAVSFSSAHWSASPCHSWCI